MWLQWLPGFGEYRENLVPSRDLGDRPRDLNCGVFTTHLGTGCAAPRMISLIIVQEVLRFRLHKTA
jgi:hypothetical protein